MTLPTATVDTTRCGAVGRWHAVQHTCTLPAGHGGDHSASAGAAGHTIRWARSCFPPSRGDLLNKRVLGGSRS